MISPITEKRDKILVHSFQNDSSTPIYSDKIRGHFIWDTPGFVMYDLGFDCEESD